MRSVFRLPDWSLRTRLVLLLVALSVVGLAVADVASYRALHNYLFDRVDQQLETAVAPVTVRLLREAGDESNQTFGPGPAGEGAAVEGGGQAVEGGGQAGGETGGPAAGPPS